MSTRIRSSRLSRLLVALFALALLATACGEDQGDQADDTGDDPAAGQDDAPAGGDINLGWIPWDENIANTFLWKEILEQEGYTVSETQLDVAPVFDGIATGQLDLFLDAWLPLTHEDYWNQYGEDIEDLGTWYEGAALTIAVPEYVEVTSLEELAENGNTFDNQIVGIEPGAGLTRITREEVMPNYGLEDWTLVESSTPAMLAELDTAIANEEPVVVTLWRPHWAYAEYPIRDLEDPQGHLGEAEEIHALARNGFSSDFPEVAEWIGNFEMTDQQLGTLSILINELGEGNEQEAARQWIADNQDVVDGWLGR